jgi:DNA polymerase elongation subunit (family B)
MVIQRAEGWILDVSYNYATDEINLFIKSQDGKVICFKQKLKDYIFYVLPKSQSAGDDLYQQLSRNDQVIKKIFWDEKYIDLADRSKTRLIGISTNITDIQTQNYRIFIKKLRMDSRVRSLYNTELSATQQFIYNQLKIALTSKVRIEYKEEELLSVTKLDDSDEIAIPPFNIMHIGISSGGNEPKLNVRLNNQMAVIFHGISDGSFGSFVNENKPDVVIMYADYHQDQITLSSIRNVITKQLDHIVVIYVRDMIEDISLAKMVEKARFSYLPLELASKYGMLRLIDSRITFELIRRNFVVPRKNSVALHHEEIRTLENIIELDKAGMIISPEIGLHENVAVLDFNDEYANIITRYNISYENQSALENKHAAILPSIIEKLVEKRVYLKQLMRSQQSESFFI